MDNLILSFNVVAPLCFVMALGYFLKYLKILSKAFMYNSLFLVKTRILLRYIIYIVSNRLPNIIYI